MKAQLRRRVFSVSQINEYIKSIFEDDILLSGLFLEGEISNLKYHSSGHVYFSIKDEYASLNCALFKSYAEDLRFRLENGQRVVLLGHIGVYPKTGQYQFYAEEVEPYGLGAMALAFEQLKEKLARAGLFDAAHKKEICSTPKCVAVITSQTGAAIHDILTVSKRRNKSVEVLVVPVQVQGDGAANQIAVGIELVNKYGGFATNRGVDTIIVGRGGGSAEDLWEFNEEVLAYAIFKSKIPVISAVGHETDFTICDFVADLRAPTPSAAAELAFPLLRDKEEELIQKSELLTAMILNYTDEALFMLSRQNDDLAKEMDFYLNRAKTLLNNRMTSLENLSPLSVLRRGYSLVYKDESLVTSAATLKENDKVTISFLDGQVYATILKGGE